MANTTDSIKKSIKKISIIEIENIISLDTFNCSFDDAAKCHRINVRNILFKAAGLFKIKLMKI